MMTPSQGTPSSHVLHPSLSEHKLCGDLRPHLSGALAEPRPFAKVKWKNSKCHLLYKDLLGIDGEAIEFEWKFIPGFA